MRLSKYQALGNDYLISARDASEHSVGRPLTPAAIRRICDRHYGIGADGILVGTVTATDDLFQLQILNPDGSEAEKSGNGLRIYAKYLWDQGIVRDEPFQVLTLGGKVRCQVGANGVEVSVEMGQVRFLSDQIPMTGVSREVLREVIDVIAPDGETRSVEISAATIGNPHCVVLRDHLDVDELLGLGPLLEHADCFPNRTNVQFMRVLDLANIQIEIWERGAGYTLASGSSSSAAAAVAKRLGLVGNRVTVHMSGGILGIEIDDQFQVLMRGPASKVGDIELAPELLADLGTFEFE